MDRNTIAKILNVIVIIGGVLLGWWLVQPVSAAQEQVYVVQAGDTLTAVAARLGVSEDVLVAQNVERYPPLAEGRLWAGWELRYVAGDHRPRWQQVLEAVGTRMFGEEAYRAWWADVSKQWARMREENGLPPEQARVRMAAWGQSEAIRGKGIRLGYEMPLLDSDLVYAASLRAEKALGFQVDVPPLCKGCKEIVVANNTLPDWAWEEMTRYNWFGASVYTMGPRVSDVRIIILLAP